jgi:hypothetical protein
MDNNEKRMDEVVDTTETTETTEAEERAAQERREEVRDRNAAPMPVADTEKYVPLFEKGETEKFRSHWLDIQSAFVDDPRAAVQKADALVEDMIQSITDNFAQRRATLENHWNSEGNVSTEDLRIAIKRYRTFFDRLLTLES